MHDAINNHTTIFSDTVRSDPASPRMKPIGNFPFFPSSQLPQKSPMDIDTLTPPCYTCVTMNEYTLSAFNLRARRFALRIDH